MPHSIVPGEKRIADFGNPPVVETVLSVQFVPLRNFTSAHFGRFWNGYLDDDWHKAQEAAFLADQFEVFERDKGGTSTGPRIVLSSAPTPNRILFISKSDDRVIQLQRTRLLYNWRRRNEEYPQHRQRMAEFHQILERFLQFVAEARLGELHLNQWEVTYVNHIPSGSLWTTPRDWHRVLPHLLAPWEGTKGCRLESLASEWHFEIEPERGRLHVALSHRRTPPPAAQAVLALELTARGPISAESGQDLDTGLNCGRQAIVETFVAVTSDEARKHWNQER